MADPLHRRLVERVGLKPGQALVDLGCGAGLTLVQALPFAAKSRLVGVDRDDAKLAEARTALGPKAELINAELAKRLPFEDRSFQRAVCHDVLECLPEPIRLLDEAHRILEPGGRLVVSHDDFDTLVWSADLARTRRLVHHHCDTKQAWMAAVDGTMGRKLLGLVRHSAFKTGEVEAFVTVETRYKPGMRGHLFAASVATMARKSPDFAPAEIEGWLAELEARDTSGDYFFSLNTYLVIAERR